MSKSTDKIPHRRHVAGPRSRSFQRDERIARARLLDQIADAELQAGHHGTAERLSHEAAELREAAP